MAMAACGHAAAAMPITASAGSAAFAASRADLDDLIKRRFFYRQAFEIYGGVAGFYTYGPPGAAVKQNLISLWRKHFVIEENLLEVDDTCIMPHDVLFTSGHVERFNDFIVKDSKDPNRFWRADKLLEEVMDAKMADAKATEAMRTAACAGAVLTQSSTTIRTIARPDRQAARIELPRSDNCGA